MTDNRELDRVNRELMREKRAAEAANRELEAFSYSVAHDLRAPLRSIAGFSQILLDDHAARLDDEARGHIRHVVGSAKHMGCLIEDLLALARISRTALRRKPTSISDLAAATIDRLRLQQPGRQVEAVIAPGLAADCDGRLVGIVLDNLIGNAWKFTSKRTPARIEVGSRADAGETVFFVRDNGAGFDPSGTHRLFGAFQRLHSQQDFEGTGIGLATVQRIIHCHGGRVWGEGQPDRGATFSFTLGMAGVPA